MLAMMRASILPHDRHFRHPWRDGTLTQNCKYPNCELKSCETRTKVHGVNVLTVKQY